MSSQSGNLSRRFVPLVLGIIAIAAAPVRDRSGALPLGVQELSGIVIDAAGTPVGDTEITLERVAGAVASTTPAAPSSVRRTRSAADGTFLFPDLHRGLATLSARRLGYRPYAVTFLSDTMSRERPLRITLQPAAIVLDTVKVEAAESPSIRAFNERRRIRRSGHFIVKADIDRRRPAYTSELLRSVPGMLVRPSSRIGNSIRIRGCRPALWLDGVQVMNAELDEVVRPGDVAGMEIYGSAAGAPPQYTDRFGRSCGAIIVWTRIR